MSSRCDDESKKGAWVPEEDELLKRLIARHGPQGWSAIAAGIPGRNGKSCRLRWCNQLDPGINRLPFTHWEDAMILRAWQATGNKWASISTLLQARTDNSVKNHWNSTLKRKHDFSQLGDNRFFVGGYTLQQLQDMMPESDVFVAPEPLWGAGAGGDDSATLSNGAWSADNSVGTPQSHFKATLGRKRSRVLDSASEEDEDLDLDELPRHVQDGLKILCGLPVHQQNLLKMAARLVPEIPYVRRPPAARQLQLHRDEASEDSAPEWDAEEAPPQAAPLHAVRQTCFGAACTDDGFGPGLVTPASFAAYSRLAAGNGYLCADETPIPFTGQGDREGVFDFCCTDARRTPDWLRAGRTPEALRPLATFGGGRDDIPAPFSALSDEAIEILRNLDSPRYHSAAAAQAALL